jgi:hypothetical protein
MSSRRQSGQSPSWRFRERYDDTNERCNLIVILSHAIDTILCVIHRVND